MTEPRANITIIIQSELDLGEQETIYMRANVHTPGGYHVYPTSFHVSRALDRAGRDQAITDHAQAITTMLQPADAANAVKIVRPTP